MNWLKKITSRLNNKSKYQIEMKSDVVKAVNSVFGTSDVADFFSKNPWLFKGVDIIAKAISSVEWRLYTIDENNEKKEIISHPFLELFDNWNKIIENSADARYIKSALEELTGQSFILIERDKIGTPIYLYHILRDQIQEFPSEQNDWFCKIKIGEETWNIPEADLLISKNPNPLDPYGLGQSMVDVLEDEIKIDEAAAKIVAGHLQNGGVPPYLIGLNTDEVTAKEIKEEWERRYSGGNFKFRGTPLFTGVTEIKVQKLMDSMKDIGAIELRKDQREQIRQIFGIPPELMGDIQNSNRATISEAQAIFAELQLKPRLEREWFFWNKKILKYFGENLFLEYILPVPEDKEFRFKVMQAAPRASFSLNDWRELSGMNRSKDLEGIYSVPLSDLIVNEKELFDIKHMLEKKRKSFKNSGNEKKRAINAIDYNEMHEDVIDAYELIISELGKEALSKVTVGVAFDIANPRVQEYLKEKIMNTQKDIGEKLKNRLEKAIQSGYDEGKNKIQIRREIEKVFDKKMKDYEIERVIKTETHKAQSYADYEGFKQSEVVEYVMWICVHHHSRDNHIAMHGQTVKLGEEFISPSGYTTLYPGEFGVAEEDIECNCLLEPVFDKNAKFTEVQIKEFITKKENNYKKYSEVFRKAYIKMFRNQKKNVLREWDK